MVIFNQPLQPTATVMSDQSSSLLQQLYQHTASFDFDQALRIVDNDSKREPNNTSAPQDYRRTHQLTPDLSAIITSRLRLQFAGKDLYGFAPGQFLHFDKPVLVVNFLGLAGVNGTLPLSDSEEFLRQVLKKEYAIRDFMDIFNNRSLSILHCIRLKTKIGLATKPAIATVSGQCLADLIGYHYLYQDYYLRYPILIYYSGVLWRRREISAYELSALIADFLRLNSRAVMVRGLVGGWWALPELSSLPAAPQSQTQRAPAAGSSNNVLGDNIVLGTKVWQQDQAVGIRLRLDSYADWFEFLPVNRHNNRSRYDDLKLFIQHVTQYQIKLELTFPKDLPLCTLSYRGPAPTRAYLGWTSVLRARPWSKPQPTYITC